MIGADQAPVLLVKSDPAVNLGGQLVSEQTAIAMPGHMHLHKQLITDRATQAVMFIVRQMVVHVFSHWVGLLPYLPKFAICVVISSSSLVAFLKYSDFSAQASQPLM